MTAAHAVSVEVDGRQRYIFETDKWKEMLGASRILARTVDLFPEVDGVHVFGPVSGEIRAWSKDRDALFDAAWGFGDPLHERGLPFTAGYVGAELEDFEGGGDLGAVHRRLTDSIDAAREVKQGGDATPRNALFAPCLIHGHDSANYWDRGHLDGRRALVGYRARCKLTTWQEERTKFYTDLLGEVLCQKRGIQIRRETSFRDLADTLDPLDSERGTPDDGRFLGFLCADGDGMGRLLRWIPWNDDWKDGKKPWERNCDFSREMDKRLRRAIATAIEAVLTVEADGAIVVPLLPQVAGGDDVWMACRREVALEVATTLARTYEEIGGNGDFVTMRAALERAQARGFTGGYSLSCGVAFMKVGYPADAMVDAAESLLRSAKRLRKGTLWARSQAASGCIDWHWVESSRSEEVALARAADWMYRDTTAPILSGPDEQREQVEEGEQGLLVLLTTRPWSHEDADKFVEAYDRFVQLPRRKREQLHQILRLGRALSDLAWERWWTSLGSDLQKVVTEANAQLGDGYRVKDPSTSPWLEIEVDDRVCGIKTPFLDLVALADTNTSPDDIWSDGETDEREAGQSEAM